MSSEKPNNESSTDRTSTKERKPSTTDAQYLQQQAQEARDAMSRVLSDIGGHVGKAADPRVWTKDYPWISVGAALAGGLVAGLVLVPSKRQQALRKLEKIEHAVAAEPRTQVESESPRSGGKKRSRGMLNSLMRQVVQGIHPAVMSALATGVAARRAGGDSEPPASAGEPASASAAEI